MEYIVYGIIACVPALLIQFCTSLVAQSSASADISHLKKFDFEPMTFGWSKSHRKISAAILVLSIPFFFWEGYRPVGFILIGSVSWFEAMISLIMWCQEPLVQLSAEEIIVTDTRVMRVRLTTVSSVNLASGLINVSTFEGLNFRIPIIFTRSDVILAFLRYCAEQNRCGNSKPS